uniref:AB hydrolase-1 domain-containing protein n=1 Tax=Rhodosorus marinus TaxID=101924 RepID=A0A7S3EKM7_9RHOD|mmetsp:Transcript_43828/g.171384  ORF Transcript_43828/g.171384 Transcript_43828/m.171384 type:complete len:282 (+) Transcript_43828:181-1026(+)
MMAQNMSTGGKVFAGLMAIAALILIHQYWTGAGVGSGLWSGSPSSTVQLKVVNEVTAYDQSASSEGLKDLNLDWYYGNLHAVVAEGKRDDILIVCIHGEEEGSTWRDWEENLGVLTDYGQVVMLDMPGFGESTLPLKRGSDPRCRKSAIELVLKTLKFLDAGDDRKMIMLAKGLNTRPAVEYFRFGSAKTVAAPRLAGMVIVAGAYNGESSKLLLRYSKVLVIWSEVDPVIDGKHSDKLMTQFEVADRIILPKLKTHAPEKESPLLFESALRSWINEREVI